VDRLLASPAYGERWGRHWLDVWRYSDWYGFGAEVRNSQPHVWRWRDYVVESLNAGRGYDRMVVEMLAGDERAPEDPGTLRATGYLVRNWYKFNRNVWLQDTVDHTAKAFLGLTLACARCHDHKYDPISQEEYYRFRAYFEAHDVRTDPAGGHVDTAREGVARVYDAHAERPTFLFERGDEKRPQEGRPLEAGVPAVFVAADRPEPIGLPERAHRLGLWEEYRRNAVARTEAAEAEARKGLEKAIDRLAAIVPEGVRVVAERERDAAVAELTAARAERASAEARIAADEFGLRHPGDSKGVEIAAYRAGTLERLAAASRAAAKVARRAAELEALRGGTDRDESAVRVAATALENARQELEKAAGAARKASKEYTPLGPVYPATSTGRRLALARWMVSPENPRTARVAVNHLWMRHFGEPLVPTVFDLGVNGKPASHPELLDWLAVELRDSGWDLKRVQRLMVTSAAYRRASAMSSDAGARNAAIDPGNRHLWRMNVRRMEAELARDNVLAAAGRLDRAMGGPEVDAGEALTTTRRSLYYRHAPEKQATILKVFDVASTTACYRRDVSVVPQQALALANSVLTLGASRRLAGELAAALPDSAGRDAEFVEAAFVRVLGRPPSEDERAAALGFLDEQAALLGDPARLSVFADGHEPAVPPAADPRQRAREGLVHVLFNHNDFVAIR
jgi:hypothetical protein